MDLAVTLIDVILAAVIGAIALAATFLLPSKTQIQNNQTQKYKSFKTFIYIAGIAALGFGIFLLLLYVISEDYQKIINILKFAALMVIGISLIFLNIQKSKFMAQCEAAGYPPAMAAPQTVVAASVVAQSQPQTYAQQVGVKAPQTVTAQVVTPTQVTPQQAPAQQIGIKVQPQVQAQQVVQQSKPATQPRVIVIKCPRCKGDMQIDTRMLGQKMKCPHCGVEGRIG